MDQRIRVIEGAELRAGLTGDERPIISGYAVLYNRQSVEFGGFTEVITPGAFGDTLGDDIRALWQHNRDQVLGRTAAGTLLLDDDETGVRFDLYPPDTQTGRDAVELIRRGDVNQMSFGFFDDLVQWERGDDGEPVRRVLRARLIEVSPVTWPMYPESSAMVRDLQGDIPEMPDWLRAQQDPDDSKGNHARARMAAKRDRLLRLHGG